MINEPGELKRFLPSEITESTPFVVLIHGLFMNGHQFMTMAQKFAKRSYAVFVYDYPTRKKHIEEHGRDFASYLSNLMNEFPQAKINIVTHSLGGIVLRCALPMLDEGQKKNIGRAVLLAPPNKGSHIAKFIVKNVRFFADFYKPLHDLDSRSDAPVHTAPLLDDVEFGVIAAKFDWCVASNLSHLENERFHTTLGTHVHSTIMFGHRSFALAEEFIRTGIMNSDE